MRKYDRIKRLLILGLLVSVFWGMTGCRLQEDSMADSVIIVIKTLCEYPGNGLYEKSYGSYISLEDTLSAESSPDSVDDHLRWKNELGSYFAEKCFDAFYRDSTRTVILDNVAYHNLTSSVIECKLKNTDKTIRYYETIIQLNAEDEAIGEYPIEWRVICSKDGSELIQRVELSEYGNFFEACQQH